MSNQQLLPLQSLPPELSETIAANLPIALAILAGYLLVFVLITHLARRGQASGLSDHIVASRGLSWLVASLTLVATVLSGVGMAGFPGTVYSVGFSFIAMILAGYAVTAPAVWYLGRRMWLVGKEHDFQTPGDLLGDYYQSDTVRLYTVISSVAFNTTYIVAQLLAGGLILMILTGGVVSFEMGVLLLAAVVAVHLITTGMRGIAYLDTFNGVLISVLLGAFGVFIISHAGGVADVFTSLGSERAGYTTAPGLTQLFTPEVILIVGILFTVGNSLIAPAAWIRMYSVDAEENFAKVAAMMVGVLTVIYIFGTSFIGIYGQTVMPDGTNPDTVSSLLAFEVMPFSLAVLFLVGVLAAIISTTDSYAHVLAATVSRDLIREFINPDISEEHELLLNKVVISLTMIAGAVGALVYPNLITPLALFVVAISVQLFTPLMGAVAWPRASTEAAIIAPAVATLLLVLFQFHVIPNPYITPLVPGILTATATNFFLFIAISYLTPPQPLSKLEEYHGLINQKL
ncbi:Na+/proline symporter [Natrialba chahannaoensis JCM 10990]|uniref:Na+/proline symporter n=1 Tax=Natrialba chahannaoensis JCM 10990 TaxID=1227492 RepID=M0B5Z7_9EURY|nr:sodium:solute symporter family protein [Natrialba chahannaoensis]ELZ05044.1 Na+/proline symporter [Natrialba chahannaoensis JCM 10990]